MNVPRNGPLSPVSVDGSDWSGINGYNATKSEGPYSPTIPMSNGNMTPPSSLNGGMNGGPRGPSGMGGGMGGPSQMGIPRRPADAYSTASSSPPRSVGARASDGTLSDQQSRRYKRMEESLAQHYSVLRRFLNAPLRDEKGNLRSNKARDKLLRLSSVQFHELSTDVYDELLRRQAAAPPPPGRPPKPEVPPHLLPKTEFHEKRNQARQKLSSLQPSRFRDLATDVFCELERRFPKFAGPPPRGPPQAGRGGPDPRSSRGGGPPLPPLNMGRGGPPGPGRGGYPPQSPGFPPRQNSIPGSGPPSTEPSPTGEFGRPLPKQMQSNTIMPTKSTMIEDDDDSADFDDDYASRRSDAFGLESDYYSKRNTAATTKSFASFADKDRKMLVDAQSQVSILQDKLEQLEEQLKGKNAEVESLRETQQNSRPSSQQQEEFESVKSILEKKLVDAQELNSTMESELEKLRFDLQSKTQHEESLKKELDEAQNGSADGGEWKDRYSQLDSEHQYLKQALAEQEKVTEEVRRETMTFLTEMKAMSERSETSWEREEKLTRDVSRLQDEVKEWRSRYTKTKTQLRTMRAASMSFNMQAPSLAGKESEFSTPDGLVKDIHVTKFQISIDELLRAARSGEPSTVSSQIKAVVMAVRHITQDIDAASKLDDGNAPLRSKLKGRVSGTANNLITASKNFALANGLSPVSLLDAAASHLTTAIIQLIRTVKIRPTPAEETDGETEDDNHVAPLQSPGYFSVAHSQSRLSANESVYSAMSSPAASVRARSQTKSSMKGVSNGFGARGIDGDAKMDLGARGVPDSDLEELKLYVEDSTEDLVHAIQSLVGSIRAEDTLPNVRSHITAIATIVGQVLSSTEATISRTQHQSPSLKQQTAQTLSSLATLREKLLTAAVEVEELPGDDARGIRDFTNTLPPVAFEVARETKELVLRIEGVYQDATGLPSATTYSSTNGYNHRSIPEEPEYATTKAPAHTHMSVASASPPLSSEIDDEVGDVRESLGGTRRGRGIRSMMKFESEAEDSGDDFR